MLSFHPQFFPPRSFLLSFSLTYLIPRGGVEDDYFAVAKSRPKPRAGGFDLGRFAGHETQRLYRLPLTIAGSGVQPMDLGVAGGLWGVVIGGGWLLWR